ncbi:MAG: hypothetical protein J5654_05270 [Victivallales bacterium]|nr:hypothetical protein [Victivallales bacterium]
MTDEEFDAAIEALSNRLDQKYDNDVEALRKRLDQKYDDAFKQLIANPKLNGRALDKAIDALDARRDREEEAELEKLEELRDQQEEEETERLEALRDQQEDEEFERRKGLRMRREEEEENDDGQWQPSNNSDDSSRFDYSDGSRIVDFETYSEVDPNDYDPSEVDGGPENEDEYFDTGEEDDYD